MATARNYRAERDAARWTRRMGEWAEWEDAQQVGILGYPAHCYPRPGLPGAAPELSRAPRLTERDHDCMAVGRALGVLRGRRAFGGAVIFGWMAETVGQASQEGRTQADRHARLRELQGAEPDLRDEAAALLLEQWHTQRAMTPARWASALGVTEGQVWMLYRAALARFGAVLDADPVARALRAAREKAAEARPWEREGAAA